jgi:hypothetical protein
MKNVYSLFLVCLISFSSFGQLKVNSLGKVTIGNLSSGQNTSCEINGNLDLYQNNIFGPVTLKIKMGNGDPGVDIGSTKSRIAFYLSGKYNSLFAANYFKVSDSIIKFNHFSIQDPLAKLMMLKPYRYNTVTMEEDSTYTTLSEYGFFSQEVESTLNEVNITENQHDLKLLDYDQIIPLLVAAVKEQQYQLDSLKNVIASCCAADKSMNSTKTIISSRQTKSEITQITPNPNTGNFQIDFTIVEPKSIVYFEILDINGQIIKTIPQNSSEGNKQTMEVALNNISAGQYLIRMFVNKQFCDTKKLLVN